MGTSQEKKMRGIGVFFFALSLLASLPARGQVFTSEFFSDPVSEAWRLSNKYCAETWLSDGTYYQRFNPETCPTGTAGADDAYSRSLIEFNLEPTFFLEFRVQTDGDRSEIPRGAPIILAIANNAGVLYHMTVSRDLVKFLRDVDLPILYIELEPGIPHTYRIELYADQYALFIDDFLIDEGIPEGPFPAYDSRLGWGGWSWELPCENAWDYIRYGVTPVDGSGDFDTDAATTLSDFYFFQQCLTNERLGLNGGPDLDAGPGCRFADFDADSDVDLLDFAEFQEHFDGLHP